MDHGSPVGRAKRAVIAAAAIAAAALAPTQALAAPQGPVGPRPAAAHAYSARVALSLPTWQDNFDWPAGHGYNGWASHVAAPDPGAYAFGAPLGEMPGLSLWLSGQRWYLPGAAEWRFDAPGTTRIADATLHLAYRDNLFAHHCLELGLRAGDASRDSSRSCNPPALSPSPDNYDVSLSDPAAEPSADQAYLRVAFPPCHNANGNGCPKWIPSLDPAGNAPLVRVKSVEMTLVDDDLPTATPGGSLHDAADGYVSGRDPVDVTVSASDAGSGVANLFVERAGGERLAEKAADCDPTHHTASLGGAICPASASTTLSVPTADLPEGAASFDVGASDLAGHEARSAPWSLFIDRTAPDAPSNLSTSYDEDSSATFVTWEDGTDPDLADGNPGSGIDHDEYRYALGAGEWTDWQSESERGFVIPGLNPGDEVTLEVRTVDRAGNVSAVASDILGVDGPVGDDSPDDGSPGPNDEFDDPEIVASAASTRDDTALAAAMRCSSVPSEFFFPKTQTGNAGIARITKPYNSVQPRIARFNPFSPTLPKCRKTPSYKLSNGDLAGGTRDVGTFLDGTKPLHFSAQRRLGWLNTSAYNANGAYMLDSFGEKMMRVKYVRGWECGGKGAVHGKYRYNVTVYTKPNRLSSPVSDCSNVTSATLPTLILQGRACIHGVRNSDAWVMVGVGLKNIVRYNGATNTYEPVADISIRGFLPASVIPTKDAYGKSIDMSELPETGCGGAGISTTPKKFSDIGTLNFYYRQDNRVTPTSSYENYNAHDLGGRVEGGFAYQYVLINTTAVSGGGIARAIVPADHKVDPRDGYSYCDPNGAGAMRTRPFTVTNNGRTYQGQKLVQASVKPRVNWTYGEVTTASDTGTHVYGWLPTSALAGLPAPTDADCRLDDVYAFASDPKDDYAHFFDVP